MLININSNKNKNIEIGVTGTKAILQNFNTLLKTRVGEVFLDRDFGIDWAFIDMPENKAIPTANIEFMTKTSKYVPEVIIKKIVWSKDGETLKPKFKIEIKKNV